MTFSLFCINLPIFLHSKRPFGGTPGSQKPSRVDSQDQLYNIISIFIIFNYFFYIVPELPPRIDRASKPPNTPSNPGSSVPSRTSSSGGTLGRSAQERLFGNKSNENLDQTHDDYATRNSLLSSVEKRSSGNSLERQQNSSLDRQRSNTTNAQNSSNPNKTNGSYDSVSSYDSYSYNTSQLTTQNIRLGPNVPDDLKSE